MSHVATVDIEIKDLTALGTACQALGLELVLGQNTFLWYAGNRGKCEHAIRVKDDTGKAYEIGLTSRADGKGYQFQWDTHNGGYGLVERTGKNCDKLRQGYAVEVAVRAAKRAGFRVVKRQVRSDGSVALVTQR